MTDKPVLPEHAVLVNKQTLADLQKFGNPLPDHPDAAGDKLRQVIYDRLEALVNNSDLLLSMSEGVIRLEYADSTMCYAIRVSFEDAATPARQFDATKAAQDFSEKTTGDY